MIFADRSRKADRYPWLEWKVRLFVIGAGLGVGGMVLGMDWLVLAGIALLCMGFFIRFLSGGKGVVEGDEEEEEGL